MRGSNCSRESFLLLRELFDLLLRKATDFLRDQIVLIRDRFLATAYLTG